MSDESWAPEVGTTFVSLVVTSVAVRAAPGELVFAAAWLPAVVMSAVFGGILARRGNPIWFGFSAAVGFSIPFAWFLMSSLGSDATPSAVGFLSTFAVFVGMTFSFGSLAPWLLRRFTRRRRSSKRAGG